MVYLEQLLVFLVDVLVARLAVHGQKFVVHVTSLDDALDDGLLKLLQVHDICLVEQLKFVDKLIVQRLIRLQFLRKALLKDLFGYLFVDPNCLFAVSS